jgi:hypothetical protein
MPWCPVCRYEYQPQVLVCSDCGATLVDQKPPEDSGKPDMPVRDLPMMPGRMYAEMLTECLDKADIPSFMKVPFTASALQVDAQIGKGVIVQVPEDCYEKALEIYHSMFPDDQSSI